MKKRKMYNDQFKVKVAYGIGQFTSLMSSQRLYLRQQTSIGFDATRKG